MYRFYLFICFLLLLYFASAQDQKIDRDSLRQAMEQRMKEYRERREIYLNNLRDRPGETLDSVRKTNIDRYANEGYERLKNLAQNDRIDTLKEIDLSFAMLEEIPEFVFKARNVEKLILDYNHIRKLPRELADLKELKLISWKYNQLEDFWWVGIKRIDQLKTLDLGHNNLTRVPVGVRKLSGLENLILDRNLFEEFPINRLAKAETVRHLSMNQCEWMKIKAGKYDKPTFISKLSLNSCKLDTIHPSFYALSGLEELQLQRNELFILPIGISELGNLKKLSLYRNDLIVLPDDFYMLADLKVIDLYYNQLTVIPEALQNLKGLEVLYLAHNKIYSLPESIGALAGLKELYLHHNQLSVLPVEISSLHELEVIRVNDNFLMEFPNQILKLDSLRDIDVSNNQIRSIPSEIKNFKKLRLFSYNDNEIDLSSTKNKELAFSLNEMSERGVVCVPRVRQETIREGSTQ